MDFVQISEPDTKKDKIFKGYPVGIDLGTTNSVIACKINNKIEVLGPILPSVYKGTKSIKRLMGTNEKILVDLELLTPVEISSQILLKLRNQAEAILNNKVTQAVITVPAHFNDGARNDTKEAAELAGFEVLRLINEPTAAALAYELDDKAEGIYLVYDLGGGTFDVSILRMEKGVFQVLATGGDNALGGDDIDKQISDYLKFTQQEYNLAREAKEFLAKNDLWSYQKYSLTKDELEEIAKPFIEKTIEICLNTIKEAGVTIENIKEIILVGGSTRLELVEKLLQAKIKHPLKNLGPDLSVAIGAAIQADALVYGSSNLLLDVTSLSIGLEVLGGLNEKIIEKNSSTPVSATKKFTTHVDGQTGMIIHVVQGEREMAADCRSLARFELKNIPPMRAGLAKVAVEFSIDVDGLLSVSAIEEVSGIKQNIAVKPSYGLSNDQFEEMLFNSYMFAESDLYARKLAEIKIKSLDNLKNIKQAIDEDADLISADELNIISALMSKLESCIKNNILHPIEEANSALEAAAAEFIQTRLNRQIKQILKGKSTAELNRIMNKDQQ